MDVQIIPGKSVGKYKLGMTCGELMKILRSENIAHKEVTLPTCLKIETENISFWLIDNRLEQITVYGDFKGKLGDVGIGSSLTDVKEHIGEIKNGEFDIVPTYELKDTKGICFELAESDLDETQTPIEAISIFR